MFTYRVIQSTSPVQMDRINRRDTRQMWRNRIYQTPHRRHSCVYLSCTKMYHFFTTCLSNFYRFLHHDTI